MLDTGHVRWVRYLKTPVNRDELSPWGAETKSEDGRVGRVALDGPGGGINEVRGVWAGCSGRT